MAEVAVSQPFDVSSRLLYDRSRVGFCVSACFSADAVEEKRRKERSSSGEEEKELKLETGEEKKGKKLHSFFSAEFSVFVLKKK